MGSFKTCPKMARCPQTNCDYHHLTNYSSEIARNPFLRSIASSQEHKRKVRKQREFQPGLKVAEHRKMREDRKVNNRSEQRHQRLGEKLNPFLNTTLTDKKVPNLCTTSGSSGGRAKGGSLGRGSLERMDTDSSAEGKGKRRHHKTKKKKKNNM